MKMPQMAAVKAGGFRSPRPTPILYDRWLLLSAVSLIILGLVMVASTSIVISERQYGQPFHFLVRQLIFLLIGIVIGIQVLRIQLVTWRDHAGWLLLATFVLLIMVLIHGIGHQVNGSMRWIGLGPIGMQVSELAKVFSIIYLADYLVRRQDEVRQEVSGFLKPMLLFTLIAILLLKEPDFGAATVILTTALGMMFLAGVRLWQFGILLGTAATSMAVLAISSPYRMERLTNFLNPWANQFDGGYQLTQSLIAFGRGSWFGVGLGASVQKLFYLPEAHTDFVFAVLAEELGLVGVCVVLGLFILLIARIFRLGYISLTQGRLFAAYCAFGFALWFALQTIINIGVNAGLLPTKGLTLPLMSYGGSSIIVMCIVLALLFRIDYEMRLASLRDYRSK